MAGRPHTRARREAAERIAEMKAQERGPPPKPRRDSPETFSIDLIPEMMALARDGYSYAEIADHWAIDEDTLMQWGADSTPAGQTRDEEDPHIVFAAALRRARTCAKACWQSWARKAIDEDNSKFAAGAWSQVMRVLFSEYDDKKQALNVTFDITRRLVIVDLRAPAAEVIEGEARVIASAQPSEPMRINPH